MKLPARCYALLHNGNIATVDPGNGRLDLNHEPEEYAAYQEIEVIASKENPKKVLVRFVAANKLFRVDRVLAREGKYDQAIGTFGVDEPTADSGWQEGDAVGPFIHFGGDSADGKRHGVVYTLTCVDKDGQLFR